MKADKNLNKARKFLIREKNYSVKDAQRVLDSLRHDLPNARLADCKFMLGLTRMFLENQLSSGCDIMQMNSTMKLLASYHAEEYDHNLNGENANVLIERFGESRTINLAENKRKSFKKAFVKNDNYKIVRIPDEETAKKYSKYTSWCVTKGQGAYDSYTNNGLGVFYFCLREGFEGEKEIKEKDCPLDSYGLSMVAVSVDIYGECNTITCRWNHDNGGNDQVMTVEQLEDILGRNFYETFKPRTREELAQVLGEEGLELLDNGGRYVYRGGRVDEKIRGLIKSVVVEDGVDSIDDYAFSLCKVLTSVTIPSSVTSIGEGAFSSCEGLTSVTIPNSVTSIGEWAFCYCSSLSSVTIPNSVTSIGNYAFSGCRSLTSINIPNSVTSIGNYAFYGCSGLTSIIIPHSLTEIAWGAFYGCSGLTSITIPNSVTSIGHSAFFGCSGLTSVTIPNSVTSIGNNAFYYCKALTSITIPNSVTSIGNGAFSGCSGLASVTIGSSVTSIGDNDFYDCNKLKSIITPNGVVPIDDFIRK